MKELKLHFKKIKCYPTKSKSGNTKRKNTVLMQRGLELNPKVTYSYCLVYLTISLISKDIQLSFFFLFKQIVPLCLMIWKIQRLLFFFCNSHIFVHFYFFLYSMLYNPSIFLTVYPLQGWLEPILVLMGPKGFYTLDRSPGSSLD